MTVNRTTLLDLPLPVTGTESGTWGDTTNNGLTQYMDIAIAGMSNLTSANFTAGALTIETTEGDSSATNISATSAQYAGFRVSSLAVNSTITVGNTGTSPARSYRLINADATYSLTFKATGQTGVTLLPGQSAVVAFNGTDYVIVGVVGAGSTTDNTVPRFDGTTGEILQSSGITIDDSNNVSGVAQLNITTLDATNIEVTNIKAKDGTAAASIADSTGIITVSTQLQVDNINISTNTISSTDTNGNIVLAPNGTGDVQLDADTVRIGDSNANATLTTNGTGDLILNTNAGTNSGSITIADAANGDISLAPNGNGSVVITNAGTSNALRITQTGSGNALLVEDEANPDSSPFAITSGGQVLIGHTSALTVGGASNQGLQTTGGGSQRITTIRYSNDTNPGQMFIGHSRATTAGTNAIVSSGDGLGEFRFYGDDGTAFIEGARIRAEVDGTPGTNDMPGRLVFSTTADGASSPTERMRIDNQGRVGIGSPGFDGIGSLYANRIITGSTFSYGILSSGAVQSDVTNTAYLFRTTASTQATSFTLSNLQHFGAVSSAFGAGSTVTNQYGFVADSTLTGATNNYGFYSNIASGTGRWNFYANGTADNYFAGSVGIGGLPFAGANFVIPKTVTGATNSYQLNSDYTVASDVTSSATTFFSYVQTQAAAFTLGNLRHFFASQRAIGAGSTITNQYGFFAESSLTGATNNYGFYSNIASGTGRWNFYANGTADNYFAGLFGIGTTTLGGFNGTVNLGGSGSPSSGYLEGWMNSQTIPSSVTTRFDAFISVPVTAAASFTLPNLVHFRAQQGTFGAGSTVSSQFGFLVDGTLTGATNNYGFFSNIASGSNRWNFYANGTASNFFGGNTIISVADNTNAALRITQTGTGDAILVEDSANPDSTPFVVDANGLVVVGHTSAIPAYGFNNQFEVLSTGNSYQLNAAFRNDAFAPLLTIAHSRNASIGSHTVLQSGDETGTLAFAGSDGTAFIRTAQIISAVDGTPGTNDMPGRLVFATTADGASNPTERMRIDSSGNVGIGGAAGAGQTLRIQKNVTGSTSSYSVLNNPTVQSDVTTDATMYRSTPSTAAAAFTFTGLYHFAATQGTIGAGSAVTNQYGFYAELNLTGATNNYGFYSNIASGSGRWNFYANGTAENYLGGNLKIGGTAARATTAGTNQLVLFDGTAPVGTLTNGVSFYSASGEARVMDAAGNSTLLSPHDAETNEWIYHSVHTPTGKKLRIDMEKMMRFLNEHFGLDFIHEE
jgi:hypothetical protein